MLNELIIQCPYCGEFITLFVEPGIESHDYIEDCTVCCRPIELHQEIGANGEPEIDARRDDD
ncbi:MAG: CPXCG motif-containing cysteine-rich protein [Gammaproteobacteria bacterium]|nr:CPXCG motif-containing cysteine-rich protein [Gammaproteobacteria bacterium]MCP5138049.1 CPXCG motif-containing cysteine-rich protein [Gammaproteobacteria bacterium]